MSTNIRYSKEWWKERLPLLQAWTEGKKLQFQDGCDWLDSFETCCFESPLHMYRIAPEPKLRPWKPKEVPVGALVRHIGDDKRKLGCWLINYVDDGGIPIPAGKEVAWISLATLAFRNEHSTDGGRTWAPCGVMEEQK